MFNATRPWKIIHPRFNQQDLISLIYSHRRSYVDSRGSFEPFSSKNRTVYMCIYIQLNPLDTSKKVDSVIKGNANFHVALGLGFETHVR